MSKNFDLNHLDILPAFWTDGIQEFISTLAENVRFELPAANQLRVRGGIQDDQVGMGIDGLWRYNQADVTITHPAGNAGVVHSIYAVASANTASLPNTDTTDYSFGIQIHPGATTPSGNHNGRAITNWRKIGETDWDGTNITGLRKMPGIDAGTDLITAIAPRPTVAAGVFRGSSGHTTDILRVELSDLTPVFSVDSQGIITKRGAADDLAFRTRVLGQSFDRWQLQTEGEMLWGDGLGALDTNLYRSAASVLKTDDTFHSVLDIWARIGQANQVKVGDFQGNAGLIFGSAQDTALHRSGVNTLRVEDTLIADVDIAAESAVYANHGAAGVVKLGTGTDGVGIEIGTDASIWRDAPNSLVTLDKMRFGGEIEIDGALNHDGTTVGLYGVTPVVRDTGWGTFTLSGGGAAGTRKTLAATYTSDHIVDVLNTIVNALKNVGILGT